jgi:hypothetical protein
MSNGRWALLSSLKRCGSFHCLPEVLEEVSLTRATWRLGIQAARRWTSQTAPVMRSRARASNQPASIHWNGQKRLAGW